MNKIFRTVWNHHRRQIVVVNENTTSHSQATGSSETSSVETFVAKVKKTLGLSMLAAAVSACFALPAQASWITDNGGKNGTLDWTVGTAGTTTWKTINEQDIEILKGETLNVLSIGSFFNESATNTLPNLMSFSKVVNRGNLNFNWKSSEKSVAVENEGNYLDNYGKFKLVYDLTPIVNAGTTVPSVGKAIHNLNGWEIYQPTGSAGSGDGKWALGNVAFYNRKGATFDIDIDVDTSKLTADLDESLYYSSVVGFHMETVRDVEITGKNAGTMTINLENPAYRARSVLLNDKSIFINESTGVMDLKTTYAPPPGENFAVNNNAFSAGIDIGGSKSKFQNDGKMTMTIEGPRAFAIYSGSDSGAASFINSKTGLVNANIVATGHGKTALEGGNAVQHVEVLGVGVNDSIENYGTFIGKATGNGVVAKGIGLNKASSHVNNYAGATLELTAKSVATAESINKAQAVGAYLNGGEQFINNGKATLKAIVDGAGTEKVANGWAIDARDAGTLVSNTDTLNLNYTGAMGGGLFLTSGAAFENSNATTITVTRPKDETVRTSLKGIYLDKTSQVTNSGNLTIAMNGSAPNASANSFRNQGGDMTGIAVLGNDESVLSLLNKKGATIAIDMTIGNSAKDQTNGIRGYGMSIVSNTRNEGTIDATVTANYGQVSADFEPFSAVGFNIDGEKATNELNLPKPRIENTGVMKADVTYTAQGMTPSISPSKAKGWAMGFNMHGTSTFVNDGTLEARSHSTVLAKGASVQGSDFINNKDAVFEAEATGDGSFAAALQVGRPNGEMVEVPSYVLNDINGTLTLTASAPKGGAHGIYHSAGKIENKGTITVSATGKNVNGVHLSKMDLERSTAVNPEFLNVGNLTITANALEAMPTVAHSANGILLESGTLTNKRTITANVSADGYARGVRVFNSRLVNEKGGRIDLVAKSGDKIYSDGVAEGIWVGKNATVENAGELNIELDSRVHFVKGIGFEDGSSVLKNTGSITITGTSHGDGSFVADSTVIDQSADAYGMYLNTNESFANDGKVSIAVDSLKEGAKAIRLQQGKFTNNASGVVDMTVQAHEKAAYGIDLDGANGSANNAGTITMDVTGGTTEKGNAYGIAHRAGSYVGNTGNMTFNLHGVTSAASNAEVGAIVTTGQGTKFKNSGRIDITGRRTGDIVTSGDVLGIRVADKGVFDNAEAGVITIDLGPTGNKQAANYYAVQVLNGSTFGNAGTVNITLDHEADNLGAVHGLLLASDAVVNNTATGSIKIDVSPEDVGLSDVLAINGQEATIRNYGTIETNGAVQVGSIVGSSASLDGGTVKFTGKDAVSTVTTELKTGTLENAGTLTVGAKDLPNWEVNVYDLKNTGTLNAGTLIALNSIDNTGVLNLDTTQRIAIGLYGKDAASGEHVTLVNRESGQLSINVDADSALLIQTGHVAGIDLFSPTNAPDLTGGDFTNFGTTNITVKSERGTNYGIVADSTHESTIRNDGTLTIDVTQTAADATYGVSGIRGNHNTTLVNNGTLSIEGATAGDGYLQGVVLYGSETSRGSFRNDGTTSITLSANDGLDPATATNAGAIGLHLSYGDGVNTGDMTLDIAGLRTDAIKLENGSTFTNSGSITVNSKASEGNDQAIFVISGSTFTNTESGHFTYNYINEDPLLKTASSDGLSTTGGSSSVNQGTIDIHLKDLAQRETGKFMKGFYVGDKATFTNSGVINLTSETQGSVEAIDGAVAVNGVFENLGDVTLDVTSHGSDRQVWVGVGTLNNKKNLTVTALNDGNGDVVGFMHDWKFTTPDVQTLHVSNEKDMTLTLTANAGDALVFDMQGQERFDNAEGGVVTANVSGGTSAKGFVLGDTTIFANDGTLNLTLTGLAADATLAGFEALSDGMTATNSGDLTITLAGNGKTAAGLKSDVAGARFVNNDTLAINATGSFENLTGIDWAGEVANAGTITTNAGLNIGSVTGAGSLTVTGGDVRVGSLTDQQSVTLRNVGSAAFDTISMKSGTLSIESGKTTAKVTGTSTLKHLTNAGNLTLGGTLTLGASGAQGSLTNTGTLTMGDAHVVGSVLNSGTFTSGDMDVAGSVHNTRTGVMQTGTLTVRGDRALTNEGEMTVADTSSVFGTLTNTGTIYLYDKSLVGEDGQIENKDELLVYGTLEVNGLLINLGTSKAEELILNGESVSGVQSAFFSMDRANEGAESIVQSGEINAKRTNYGKDYWGTVTVNAVYENHDLVFAGSSDTVLDQSGQALAGSGMTIAAGGSILNHSGATLRVNGVLDNSGTISGGTLALDAGGQFTNRKNVNVDKLTGSNLTFTQGEAGASFETAKNEVTNSQFVWTQGSISLDALGKGNRYELGGHVGDSVTVDLDLLTSDSTVNIGQGAELAVGTISLDGTESTVTLAGGTLKTSLDQIFSDVEVNGAVDIDAESSKDTVNVAGITVATGVGGIKDAVSKGIAFNSGTVAFTDRVFALDVAGDVLAKLEADDGGSLEVAFNGKATGLDAFTVDVANKVVATKPEGGSTYAVFTGETLVNKDAEEPGLGYTQLVVGDIDPRGRYTPNKNTHRVEQSMGFKNVTGVTGGLYINDARFVLVGDKDQAIDLADGLVQVIGGSMSGDGLTLGSYGSEAATKGHLAELNLGVFAEDGGYRVAGGATDVHNGDFTVDALRLGGTLTVGDKDRDDKGNAKLTIGNLTAYAGELVNHGNTHIGTVASGDDKPVIKLENYGSMTIDNGLVEGRLLNKEGGTLTTGNLTLGYTDSLNNGTWTAESLTIAGAKQYVGDLISRGELYNASTLNVANGLTLESTALTQPEATGGVLTNRSTIRSKPAALTVGGTFTMKEKSSFTNEGKYALFTADAMEMAQGSTVTNRVDGAITIKNHANIAGNWTNEKGTSTFGSLTVTNTGAMVNNGTLAVTGKTELAGSVTGTGNATLDDLTIDPTGVLAMTGAGALTAGDVVVNAGGKMSVAGASTLGSLTATNAGELAFGTLSMTGDLNLTGSVMTALLSQAGNVTLSGSQLTSQRDATLASLTMTGSEAAFGNTTVAGDVSVTGGVLTTGNLTGQNLTVRDQASVNGKTAHVASLDAKDGTIVLDAITSDGTILLDNTTLKGHVVSGADMIVTNAGAVTSTGATTLDSLTMTNAEDSSFGDLTVNGNVSLTGTKLTANLVKGGDTTLSASDITSKGTTELTSLAMTNGSNAAFGTLTVNGALDVNASTLTGDVAQAGATTVTNGAQVTSSGKTTLASLTMTNAKDSAFGELTVTGDVNLTNTKLDADLRKAGNVTLEGATLASAGATTVENFAQTNGTTTFGDLTAKTVSVADGAFTTAGLTAETAAFAGRTSQVTLNGLTTVGTLTATGTNVKMSDLVITDALTNDSTLTGKTFKAQGADGKAVSVTNTGTIRFDGASGSVAYSQTAGALEVAKNGFTDSTFDVKGGTVKTNGLGKGNAWTLGGVKDASVLMTLDRLTSEGSVSINEGATLETSLITLDGKTETVVLAGGTLATMMDQIFDDVKMNQGIDIGAGKPGDIVDVEGLNAVVGVGDIKDEVSTGIGFNAGTVAFNDKVYSLTLAADVLGKLEADDGGDLEVVFNGRANVNRFTVDVANGIEATQGGKPAHAVFAGETLINADKTQPDLQYTKLVVGSAEPAIADAHNLTQSMGFMNVTGVTDGLFIRGEDTEFVLVGVDEKAQGVGDIHSFMLADGVVDVGEGAAFTLGSYGKALGTEGKLTAITNNGTVNVKNGLFTVETLTGNGTVAVSDKDHAKVAATLKVTTLEQNDVSNFGTIEAETATIGTLANTGTLNAKTLALTGVASTNVGTIHAEIARLGESVNLTNTGSWTGNALDVDGTFVHNGKTLDVATATIDGTLTNAGAADIDALTINGHVDQTGSLTAKGVTVANNADIVNNGSLTTDTLTLNGTYAGKGGLNAKTTTVVGTLTSSAKGIHLGELTVTDGDLMALNLTTGNASVTGKSTVAVDNWTGKTLTLEGTTTVADAMTSDALTTTGTLTAGNLTTKTLEQSGTLRVTKTLTADNATLSGKATVDGLLDVDVLTQKSGELVAQNVDATEVSLSGKADVGTLASDTLTVSGSLEADEVTTSTYEQTAGSADIGTLTSTTLANAGDMTVGTMDAALANTGTLTIKTGFALTGSNASTITAEASKGTLTDFTNNGTASFGKTTATGLANNGTITFADATLEGANNNTKDMSADILNVKGSLTTTGTLTASNTTVTGTLSVNGGKTSLDALNLKGTLGTKGELTARKAEITGSFNLTSGKTTIGNATVNKGHVNVAGGSFHADAYTQKGGSLTLAQGGSFTSGNLIVSGSDITLGDAALNAEGSIKDSNITITAGNWADNLLGLTNTDKGALDDNDFTITGGLLDLGDKTLTSSGSVTMTGGTLVADKIALDGKTEGVITVGGKGSLQTSLDQIFHDFVVEGVEISATNWEEGWGGVHGQVIEAATDVGDIKSSITTGIKFEGGSLSFTDEAFRTDLVAEVGSALADAYGNGKVNVEFLGHAVDDFTLDTIHKLEQDGMGDKTQGLVFAGDDLINNSGDKTLDVGKSDTDDIHMNTGFAGVTDTDRINIKDGLEFVLVGKIDKDGNPSTDQLLTDAENGGSVHVDNGTLTLGSNGVKDKTGGTLAEVVLDEQGNLVIKNGDFTVDRIESDGSMHVTGGGKLTSNDVTLDKGDSHIDEGGVLVVEDGESNGNLHIKGDGTLTNEGTLIAGGKDSHVDTLVDGDLVNKGTGLYDDMTITNGGHYHNTSTGKDAGDRIDVAEGGKWTNDGQSSWGQVDINGQFENNGGLEIGDDKAETDDFHVGPEGSVDQNGQLDASNAGHAQIDGSFTTGELTPEGKPDDNAWSKFDDVTVGNGGHLENNGTELGNGLVVDQGGEYVNNGHSNWGSVDIAGNGDNNGDLTIRGDGKDDTPDFIVEGSGSMTNDGTLIAGGEDTKNDTLVEGDLVNKGTGLYDDMTITNGGHYHNTSTGKDQGDKIDVAEGGKWTNDGQSSWGQVDINGGATNNGDLIIGNGNDKDDDFHIGPDGSLENNGHIDAGNSGTADIEGDLINGSLTPEGKPDKDATIKFEDAVVHPGGKLENNGTEEGDSLVVENDGEYINNGNSNWNDVTINEGGHGSNNGKLDVEDDLVIDGIFDNDGTINAGNTVIGGDFNQTDDGVLNTGDLTVRPGGDIDMDKGEINVSGDLNLNGANVVIGNWKALSPDNRISPTWSAEKPLDGKLWVIGNGDLTFGTASAGFADKIQKFDEKVPGLTGAAARVTVGQTVTMGKGSSLAVGSNVWNPAKDEGRVEMKEGSVYFGRDSYVLIDIGSLGDAPAFATTVEGATATVEHGASLVFGNLTKTGEFTLLEGFDLSANLGEDGDWKGGWDGEDLYIVNDDGSGLDYFIQLGVDKDGNKVSANVNVADLETVYPDIVLPGLGNEALQDCSKGNDSSFICGIVKDENLTVEEKTRIINSVAQIASVGGTTASAYADMGLVSDVLEDRLSFTGPTHKDGQLLQIPATDALWVEVIGGKTKTGSLALSNLSGGLKSDTYGVMIGADALMPKPAVKVGGAFSYLSGSLTSTGSGLSTTNDYDTYGAHLYAAWTPTTKFNLVGHVDWMLQDSDISMSIGTDSFGKASAKPNVNVAQAGIRAEVRETVGVFDIVPHVGLRAVYTKTDDFKTKIDGKNAFRNALEDTFTVQLPIGLTVSGYVPAQGGWTVAPKADITFVPQVGDTDQTSTVYGTAMSSSDSVNGAFAGEYYGQVKLGLTMINPKADSSFGGTVGYARGDAGKKDLTFGVQFTKNF